VILAPEGAFGLVGVLWSSLSKSKAYDRANTAVRYVL